MATPAASAKNKAACIRYLSNHPKLDADFIRVILKAFASTQDTSTQELVASVKVLDICQLSDAAIKTAAEYFSGTHSSSPVPAQPPVRNLRQSNIRKISVVAPVAPGAPDVVGDPPVSTVSTQGDISSTH